MNAALAAIPADRLAAFKETCRAKNWVVSANGINWLDEADGDEDHAVWLVMVEVGLLRRIGLGLFEIEDVDTAAAYEGDIGPAAFVAEVVDTVTDGGRW